MSTQVDFLLAPVNAPPARPPLVGLIPACDLLGPDYLIDDVVEDVESLVNDRAGNPLGTIGSIQQRWLGGYRYATEQLCAPAVVRDPCTDTTLTVPAEPAWTYGLPVLVETGDTCSAFGWQARNYRARATRALLAAESAALAKELWAGAVARGSTWTVPYFQAGTYNSGTNPTGVHILSASAVTPAVGLALLEQGVAVTSNGAQAMIHCTRQMGSALSELGNTFRDVQGQVLTYLGNVICPDAGYPGTGPNGEAETGGAAWAFVTLLPTVRRSPIEIYPETFAEALDKTTNTVTFNAKRYMSATFPPCTLCAVQVSLPTLTFP